MAKTANDKREALSQLAAYCGIADTYHDIWGKAHAVTDESIRAILKAMRLPVDDDPAEVLLRLEEREWRRPLPPVHVTRLGDAMALPVSLTQAQSGRRHQWTLTSEAGTATSACFIPAELKRLGERRFGKKTYVRSELGLPVPQEAGYYRFELEQLGQEASPRTEMTLAVVPHRCYQPEAVDGDGRLWGPTVQLYGVRSRRNWGIGDFTDLNHLIDLVADAGGGVVGVSPLHDLFPEAPARISPYSPSSRCFVNTLFIDIEAVPEFAECRAVQELVAGERFQVLLRRLRTTDEVDYADASAAKREVLALLYRHFCDAHLAMNSGRARAFNAFREQSGEALERHARFEALQAHFHGEDAGVYGWPAWPEAFRHPDSPAVAEFAASHADEIGFFPWLQWLADEQLAAVGFRSWRRGLGVGVFQDLALGASPDGSECWCNLDVFADGAYAGAPPDEFSPLGQDWGLPPFIPLRLREAAYAPFINLLRANMRHSGALRIDHAMGLMRLFWVPAGSSAKDGAYVANPFDDLLGILALESQRNRCMVVGEDLGTVPEGFRPRLADAGVLSYRPLIFERNDSGGFKSPDAYPQQALVAVSTHDLPTLRGFWQGRDIDLRHSLNLLSSEDERSRLIVDRAQDRARFLVALENAGLLPEGRSVHPVAVPEITPEMMLAVHAFLAQTPSRMLVVQPEDVLGVVEQANLPGSRDDQHPNWRRRLPLHLEDWRDDERFVALADRLRQERGSAVAPHDEALAQPRSAIIPRATYRLQFNRDFTFAQAADLAPYLAELGVSHCYASPYLRARPGSMHGYDIVDHGVLNPEIGEAEDFEHFVAALKAHGLGQILDIVPNHMGVMGADNGWWMDVLENGPASAQGNFFDIDWEPLNPELRGKVLLPLLGDHYGTVLERGELKLVFDAAGGEFSLFYYQHRLPIDPATYPRIVGYHSDQLAAVLGDQHLRYVELQALLNAFGRLPARTDTQPEHMLERQRDKEVYKRQLAALCESCPEIARHIADNVLEFNGIPGDSDSYDPLHELLQLQGYRLAYWRVASDDINYRRFFDINDLAAVRVEEPAVFEATHRFVLDLVKAGKVDGLRVDHPDGLFDPGQYFRRLPDDWAVHGTTGYRFANLANGLFVDSTAERRMTRVYETFAGISDDFEDIAYRAKKLIMRTALSSELNVLATRLTRIAAASRETCDFTLNGLRAALVEVVACFPVYRSYVNGNHLSVDDRRHIGWALAVARKRSPVADPGIFDFIHGVLTTDIARGRSKSYWQRVEAFAMKFQQFSSPVMAKGVEDTAFYRYHRLISLNEVGGEPRRFGTPLTAFHGSMRYRAVRSQYSMLTTSTHDSKRSEDVRSRINVLSEMPAAWKLMLRRWARLNRARKRRIEGVEVPSRNDEYLLYQTLVGSWPLQPLDDNALETYRQRIDAYMIKALREAKEHSSWANINAEYEAAMSAFVAALLAPGDKNLFLADFTAVVRPIAYFGLLNSLALSLIKLTAPGVPDIYQGCESWQFNLVDPDNRRPLDFAAYREQLAQLKPLVDAPGELWRERLQPLLDDMSDGRIKLYLHWQGLALRQRWPEVFRDGEYWPISATGSAAAHVCAYARRSGGRSVLVVVPRLTVRLLAN